ncbi:voltage-gated potassium channel [Lentzea xinjiangensis]|uniref:Voltage-gated potassium channel n=1 Tax=Lentzea xinjiangensis TaxID=402600 RepID=A0A1H9AJX7_9PSEU|nr:potassium channel family protein [Lentzea xinjiangensis]SEP76959.1 voltage-gated potassium channel [Lentzea xinjiangensis]
MPPVSEARLERWERKVEWPLTVLAVVFLAAYAWQVFDDHGPMHFPLEIVLWLVWAVFAADFVARLALARDKGRFLRTHIFDLAVVVLPMVRQLRVLRLITVIALLNKKFQHKIRQRVSIYVAGVTMLVVFSASLAVLDAERHAENASITTFGDALWWTMTTMSTVGYGDRYPVTAQGRLVAALLMVGGIALLGVITGTIASWLVEKLRGVEEAELETAQELRNLRAEIAELRAELRAELKARGSG